ncbi:MAG: histidinol-phosphate transaminase [Bdellovibrionaceae bacterium]|nr:histidinol-phosphate transaminase [Pseudobdellovibrionaceae bacterium]|tara:strand:+ start:171 stop:1301 length:1131 start_codon:yes stop_codon:yes gene_type:complete
MLKFVSDSIKNLVPYQPGKPIEEVQRELGIDYVVKLASNENPLGPSPLGLTAAEESLSTIHRYPDGGAFHLRKKLSKRLGVTTQQLVFGNGSNEVIELIVRTFCRKGDSIITSEGAFIAYFLCAKAHEVNCIQTPLLKDGSFDLNQIAEEAIQNSHARVIFLPNPNNPTGTVFTEEAFRAFYSKIKKERKDPILIVFDDAYSEYRDSKNLPDPIEWMKKENNVLVTRTFSKAYGLSGLRVGYAVGPEVLIQTVEKIREPFNVNAVALAAATAALEDQGFIDKTIRLNREEKLKWESFFKKHSIPFFSSQGNFILADFHARTGMNGVDAFEELLKRGVILRPVTGYGFPHHLRVSIGTQKENEYAMTQIEEWFHAMG